MKVLLVALALFALLAFATGNTLTAKEAHDKMVECEKRCARAANLLRCKHQCNSSLKQQHHPTLKQKHGKKPSKKMAEKKHAGPRQNHHKPKSVLLKGRRVTLEMRQRKH